MSISYHIKLIAIIDIYNNNDIINLLFINYILKYPYVSTNINIATYTNSIILKFIQI